jgi:hypothetical protein
VIVPTGHLGFTCSDRRVGSARTRFMKEGESPVEELRVKTINTTVDQYRVYLRQVRAGSVELLSQLAERKFDLTSPALRANILQFYSDLSAPIETKDDTDRWKNVLASLDRLKSFEPISTVAGEPSQGTPLRPGETVTKAAGAESSSAVLAAQ